MSRLNRFLTGNGAFCNLWPMNQPISLIRNQEWPDIQSFIHFTKISRLNANFPLLLTSDGTLTRSLQALVRSQIYLEVIRQEIHGIEEESAQHLDLAFPTCGPVEPKTGRVGDDERNEIRHQVSLL